MYKLIIQDDEGKTTVVPLIREELTIGRQEGNTIRLTERNVSRKHAKLLRGTEEIIIEDLDSYNGVRVNGSRIQGRAEIKEADRVQIGDYLIEVKADQPNADAETREIAVIPESEVPAAIGVSASEAATAPTSVPVSTPPPSTAPAPAPAPAVKANGTGPNLTADVAASIVTPDEHASGRLVILSKTMAGREFVLDKPAMVIGRTEENDIWVNHRSISRHHAKVVRENGNYAIVDLQSANGVRVNGEEYGKVELRTRDVVDLGHVRFRFVAPNEDFLFGRDAQPVDIATEGQSSKMLWAAVALLVVGVIAFFILSGDKDSASNIGVDTPTKPLIDDPPQIDDPPPLPVMVADASVGTPPQSANDIEIARLLGLAATSQKREEWAALILTAKRILEIDSEHGNAKMLLAKGTLEKDNQATYQQLKLHLGKKQLALAAADFEQINEESDYKAPATEAHEKAKVDFGKSQVAAARRAAKSKTCAKELATLALNVPKQWANIVDEIESVKCSQGSTRPPTNTTNNNTTTNVKPPPPKDPPGPTISIADLVEQAEQAVRNTQYGKGGKLCRQALDRDPNNQRAITACAIAACNLQISSAAKKYVRRIKSSQRRQGLQQVCLRLGVTVPD